jgi:hypothetical protein
MEKVNRDQITIFRKMYLKNHEEIILSSEFMELDLEEFKLLFYKPALKWKIYLKKIDVFLYVVFVVKIVTQIISMSFV